MRARGRRQDCGFLHKLVDENGRSKGEKGEHRSAGKGGHSHGHATEARDHDAHREHHSRETRRKDARATCARRCALTGASLAEWGHPATKRMALGAWRLAEVHF